MTDTFNEVFPYYLSAGMTPEQFWDGEPWLTVAYRKKLELENDRINEEAWLAGYYNFIGVSTALANAFRKKGAKAVDYIKQPLKLRPDTAKEKAAKKKKATEEGIAFIEQMQATARKKKNGGN